MGVFVLRRQDHTVEGSTFTAKEASGRIFNIKGAPFVYCVFPGSIQNYGFPEDTDEALIDNVYKALFALDNESSPGKV